MFHFNKESRLGRGVLLAAVIAGAAAFAVPAIAGECPADQKKPNAREAVDLKPVGVTDTTIAAIDVSKAPFNIDGRNFRMRKLVVEPGGIVPWHSHADRPAIIYIVEGEIHEYASNCSGRSCMTLATSWPRPPTCRIGGRISATRPSSCSPPTS